MTRSGSLARSGRPKVAATLALMLLAVLGNVSHLPLLYGVDFVFGSAAAMLALALLGTGPACLVALTGGLYTVVLWGHPYALAISLAEVGLVGWLYHRRGWRDLVVADLAFWLIIGIPLELACYRFLLGLDSAAVLLIGLKQPLNGIFNALLAGLALLAIGCTRHAARWLGQRRPRIESVLFHVMLASILAAGSVPIVYEGRWGWRDRERLLAIRLEEQAARLLSRIEQTPGQPLARWGTTLSELVGTPDLTVALLAADGRLVAWDGPHRPRGEQAGTLQELGNGFGVWLPHNHGSAIERWRHGVYRLQVPAELEGEAASVMLETPAGTLAESFERSQAKVFSLVGILLLAGIALARTVARVATRPLRDLAAASESLSACLAEGKQTIWPTSRIEEYACLGNTLRAMSERLASSFREMRDAQSGLEQQVQARTAELTRLSRVASATTNAVVITDPDGRIEWVNEGFTRLCGYRLDEVLGHRPGSLLQGDETDPSVVAEMNSALATARPFEVEVVNYKKSGEPYWVRINCNPLCDDAGQLQGFIAIESDVTRERRDADRIRSSERRLAAVIEGTNIGTWEWNVQTGETVLNERWAEICGYRLEELQPTSIRTWTDLAHPSDLHAARDALERHFAGQTEYYDMQCRMRHRDGRWVWVHTCGRLVTRTADGEPEMMYGTHADITRQKKIEADLRDQAEHTQTILDNICDAIITIDRRGVIEAVNSAAERIFGFPSETLQGSQVGELLTDPPPESGQRLPDAFRPSGEPGRSGITREWEGRRQDGQRFPMEITVSEITRQGEPLFVAMIRDISERKRVESLKSEFVSTVSHELRTPLTAIGGALRLMTGGALGKLPESAQQMLEIAEKNSQRLTFLINDLLDLEKLSAGKLQFDIRRQPLLPLVEQAVETNRNYGSDRGVSLVLSEGSPEVDVRVDGQRLQQVLSNLLSNAIKYSPDHGAVVVDVTMRGNAVRVSVSDDGPGVPAEFRERIFQRFAQADSSDTRKAGGTGLGLALSKDLIERMGGSIGFESVEGEGATFHFELPRHDSPPSGPPNFHEAAGGRLAAASPISPGAIT